MFFISFYNLNLTQKFAIEIEYEFLLLTMQRYGY